MRSVRSVGRDEEQRPVVAFLAAELPGVDDADRVLLDLLGFRRPDDQHGELRALPRLEGGELRFEAGALALVQDPGKVRDARAKLRDRLQVVGRGREGRSADQRRRRQRGEAQPECARHALCPGQFDGGLAGGSAGFAGALKSTTGGFAIADSFSTGEVRLHVVAEHLCGEVDREAAGSWR
jgi:hypothetical protein